LAYHLDISVLIAMAYGLEVHGSITGRGRGLYSNPHSIQAGFGACAVSYLMDIGGHFLVGKAAGMSS
jgi:hypothetical protein